MLPPDQFKKYNPGYDPYYLDDHGCKFDDLVPYTSFDVMVSIMISTWNRYSQLARSLECYARQSFKDFELLINDDGSTQDIKGLVEKFSPYLNIQYFYTPRTEWVSCPSRAYKKMMPHCQSDIWVITHPEMLLSPDAVQFIYDALEGNKVDAHKYILSPVHVNDPIIEISEEESKKHAAWVSLRPGFLENPQQLMSVDWHSNVDNLTKAPGYMSWGGFAGRPNLWHSTKRGYPWWFVGAAKSTNPIWEEMHETVGHATIDMWLCGYRGPHKMVDIVPNKVMCYHQPHQTSAVAPMGELDSVS